MTVHVAVGVVTNTHGEVLIARRHEGAHLGGKWEFPGGKIEASESIREALCREIEEETTLQVFDCEPLITVEHDYTDKSVVLHVLRVTDYAGTAIGNEQQDIRWCSPEDIKYSEFPDADRKIISTLLLPECIAITGKYTSDVDFTGRLSSLIADFNGVVQVRTPGIAESSSFLPVLDSAINECHAYDVQVMLNADQHMLNLTNADGIHLNSRLLASTHRRLVPVDKLFSASCHNLEELQKAEEIGVDFVFLSPVLPTSSHPDAPALGWDRFRSVASQVCMPVYALGGMNSSHVGRSRENGGQGIAAISSLWK